MSIVTASFAYSPASPAAGQPVQFTDTSAGSPIAWRWDFNDGATSTAQNPNHSYASSGSYTIMLTVSNSSGSTYATQIINVLPASTLSASFSYSPASPVMGESIQFTDTSAGNPTSWQWSFGDGATSTAKDPIHSYTTTGSKIVALEVTNGAGSSRGSRTVTVVGQAAIIVNHASIRLDRIPTPWIDQAKQKLHIAYGHTSHGSQISTGMAGLVAWKGATYSFNSGGAGGALDVRDYYGNFGGLGVASDLGNPNRTAWESATRTFLDHNPAINVIIWSWCGQVDGTEADIQLYLSLMSGLEHDFPNVKFVYMTGHTDGAQLTGNVPQRNQQIRDYCIANNKILYDFADIESDNPDGTYFGDKLVNDACDYDSNGDGVRDRNWAIDWQNANPGKWYQCESAHSQPLNANMKAYAAWHLWARLAGWDGN
jgi:PKD repeat protein